MLKMKSGLDECLKTKGQKKCSGWVPENKGVTRYPRRTLNVTEKKDLIALIAIARETKREKWLGNDIQS
jgi:hypothetical protein